MNSLFEAPLNGCLAASLVVVALLFLVLSIKRFRKARHRVETYAGSRWFIRGIRCLLIALTAGVWAAGLFWNIRWLLIIGLVIICQELFEGVMLGTALRQGEKLDPGGEDPRIP